MRVMLYVRVLSELVDVIVESDISLTVDAHDQNVSDSAPEVMKYNISTQVFRYSFVTLLIENEIDHETVDFSVVISSVSSESPRADYDLMIVPTASFSSESSGFLTMIQHVVSSSFSFTGCLEFIPEFSLPLAEFNVCHPRHPHISHFLIIRSYA